MAMFNDSQLFDVHVPMLAWVLGQANLNVKWKSGGNFILISAEQPLGGFFSGTS